MQPLPSSVDAAVIGGGPVGCVTALSFARRGARTLLLEARPQAARRLAGEWVHPPGVHVLRQLGVELAAASARDRAGRGFVVFPHDQTAPVVLNYPDGATSLAYEHSHLVAQLREAADADPNIHFVPFARVTHVEGQRLTVEREGRPEHTTVVTPMIVGAYGRAAVGDKSLQLPGRRAVLSRMAGLLLEDAPLPFEGYGHVVLGGPGPMLIYRLSDRHVRVCIDVPSHHRHPDATLLWAAYSPLVPPALRPAFRKALEERPIMWAANQFAPRIHYGREGFALVGDAVGHFHPLSANGLTLGFMDAECIARSESFLAYKRERVARSFVQELLSTALYETFTLEDRGTVALRQAMYQLWRREPFECVRTMRLLGGEDTSALHFSRSFLKVMRIAVKQVAGEAMARRQWRHMGRTLLGFGGWLQWLAMSTLPRLLHSSSYSTTSAPTQLIHRLQP